MVVLLVPTTVFAQGSFSDVRAKYGRWTQLDASFNGYVKHGQCIQHSPQGGMGYHAWKTSLIDGTIDPANPEGLLIDQAGSVLGVVYVSTAGSAPSSVFGMQGERFSQTTGAAATRIGLASGTYWTMHVWFVSNPSGTFAPWNPNVSCPTGPNTVTVTDMDTGDLQLPWGVLLAVAGAGVLLAGFGIIRRTASRPAA